MTNPVVHFEFAGPDEQSLHAFHRGVFGWTVKSMGPGYALVETPAGSPNGALREAESPELTLGIGVTDLTDVMAKAIQLGGTVVMEPLDNGFVTKAKIADPAGNIITLIEDGS